MDVVRIHSSQSIGLIFHENWFSMFQNGIQLFMQITQIVEFQVLYHNSENYYCVAWMTLLI